MNKDRLEEIDYLIYSCIVNSDETVDDTLSMVERFTNMRDYCKYFIPLNIQNPRPVGDETDNRKEI